MKNTIYPHKFWRPFLDCMPQLFLDPNMCGFQYIKKNDTSPNDTQQGPSTMSPISGCQLMKTIEFCHNGNQSNLWSACTNELRLGLLCSHDTGFPLCCIVRKLILCPGDKLVVPDLTNRNSDHCGWSLLILMHAANLVANSDNIASGEYVTFVSPFTLRIYLVFTRLFCARFLTFIYCTYHCHHHRSV